MLANEHRSTGRVLDILLLIADEQDGLTLTQIANAIDAPKSSLFPIIQTMRQRHFLHYTEATARYRIGSATFHIGMSYLNRTNAIQLIGSEMNKLVDQCEETSFLAVLEEGRALYLLKKDTPKAIRMIASVGVTLPAYATGIGKALLMDSTIDALHQMYPEGLSMLTPNTITDLDCLYAQLQSFRSRDVAFECEESNHEIRCCATPLRKNGRIVAAISVAAPVYRCDDNRMNEICLNVLQAKHAIEQLLTHMNIEL